jgi:hypothetical protein
MYIILILVITVLIYLWFSRPYKPVYVPPAPLFNAQQSPLPQTEQTIPSIIEPCRCFKDPAGKCAYKKLGNGDKDIAICGPAPPYGCKALGCGVIKVECTCMVHTDGRCVRVDPKSGCSQPAGVCKNPACLSPAQAAAMNAYSEAKRNLDSIKTSYESSLAALTRVNNSYQNALKQGDNNAINQHKTNLLNLTNNNETLKKRYETAQEALKNTNAAYSALFPSAISNIASAFISAFGNVSSFLNKR